MKNPRNKIESIKDFVSCFIFVQTEVGHFGN